MTRIDFYILDDDTDQAREYFVCRLIEQVQQQGHTIFILSDTKQHAAGLDELLWSYKPESFVPHLLADHASSNTCSVILGTNQMTTDSAIKYDILINFDTHIPDSFSHYSRVIEIVNKKDNSTIDGRTRYRYYKDRGYKMESHNIRG